MKKNKIICGDAIEELKKLPENSIDAIITDPPYGLGFMNKEWDNPDKEKELIERERKRSEQRKAEGISPTDAPFSQSVRPGLAIKGAKENKWFQEWSEKWSKEAIRILKPGGYMLVCCATRMYHRMTCGIEDAGFEIRDTIMWLYGSGFPKSLNIGKQIDKIQGNEREFIEVKKKLHISTNNTNEGWKRPSHYNKDGTTKTEMVITKGSSEWEGWGTALKPACEPIVVARKPLSEKNVALNVLKHGTGGINIDDCRVDSSEKLARPINQADNKIYGKYERFGNPIEPQGRFPANIILDEESAKMLDEQSGDTSQGHFPKDNTKGTSIFNTQNLKQEEKWLNDKGGASRFFYCAKASKSERNFGLDDKQPIRYEDGEPVRWNKAGVWTNDTTPAKNNHPTVKPIKLMEYLIKLVSREGAIVLDPFVGSGTTLIACAKLGRIGIGIEKEEEYVKIANARIKPFLEQTKL